MKPTRSHLISVGLIASLAVMIWWNFDELRALFGSDRISVQEVRKRWIVDLPAIQRIYGTEYGITPHDLDLIRDRVGSLEIDLRTEVAVVQAENQTWSGAWSAETGGPASQSVIIQLSGSAPLLGNRAIFTKFRGRLTLQFDEMAMILTTR